MASKCSARDDSAAARQWTTHLGHGLEPRARFGAVDAVDEDVTQLGKRWREARNSGTTSWGCWMLIPWSYGRPAENLSYR